MTDRDKIIETVLDTDITGIKIRSIVGGISAANAIADALVAAGIGDISKWQLMSKVLHNQIIENSREEKHRTEVLERALDKACEDIKQLMDCCRWAAGGGVITIKEYTPEKATPQAYIERSEKGEEDV